VNPVPLLVLLPVLGYSQCHDGSTEECKKLLVEKHLPFGFPSTGELLYREGYILSHNNWLKIPNWVAYHIDKGCLDAKLGRSDDFRPDTSLKEWQRAELEDYRRSGYDRGHLAPSADMKCSEEMNSDSFLLSNMAPQIGIGFNRGIWKDLEDKVRDWARTRKDVYVFTGPAFDPVGGEMRFRLLGKDRVAVPTHFFKIVIDRKGPGQVEAIAFLLPNQKLPAGDLKGHLTSIEAIERMTGLDFLEKLPDEEEDRVESMPAKEPW